MPRTTSTALFVVVLLLGTTNAQFGGWRGGFGDGNGMPRAAIGAASVTYELNGVARQAGVRSKSRRAEPADRPGKRRRQRKTATETGIKHRGPHPRTPSGRCREWPTSASLWRYLGCFDGGRGRTDRACVNYWGREIRMDKNLAPQVGLEPTTLRLTANNRMTARM